jgi:hypothetical protein
LARKRSAKGAMTCGYDKADRIQSATTTGQGPTRTTSYTVDNHGNLVLRHKDSFAYDQANRLTGALVARAGSADAYDGDGKRASQAAGGTTTSYAYDVNASLPQC